MTSVSEIGYFRVTNREFEASLKALKLESDEISNLPEKAIIVEIGSGLDQNFANEVKNIRDDIRVISVDPTLGLPESKFFTTHERSKDGQLQQVSYTYYGNDSYYKGQPPSYADSNAVSDSIRTERVISADKTGNVVAGLAPEIPFAADSIDLLIDLWGPGLYLERYKNNSPLETYLQNIVRVLKRGGQARIYPIDNYNETLEETAIRNANAIAEYTKILEALSGVGIEFYDEEDPALGGAMGREDATRIGIKISKH